ncbi:uncharacterized protein LOC115949893 [Quercus lobata]|uniref:uncharacterized protein LOC115949893 n=1 Tax=Quercus lobata TaxID=97700 RepID=UPI0012478D44|nr:uncharacterized protein LOC115949893 [Quercus lobata]
MIRELFDPADVPAILSIPLPMRHKEDKSIWVPNAKGVFTVKSAYHSITNKYLPNPPSAPWKKIWNLNAPEHLKMFLWRIGVNVLPTRENLLKRFDVVDSSCVHCGADPESAIHVFFTCTVARALWHSACWGFRAYEAHIQSSEDIIKLVLEPLTSICPNSESWRVSLNMALTLDGIWNLHNQVLFHEDKADIQAATQQIQFRLVEFSRIAAPNTYTTPPPSLLSWTPPPFNCIEIKLTLHILISKLP